MWKTEFPREDEVPRLINPRRQIFFPFPSGLSLPLGNCVGCLKESQAVAGRLADEQAVFLKIEQAVQLSRNTVEVQRLPIAIRIKVFFFEFEKRSL